MNTNGWTIEKGDYNRSFKDEKQLQKKALRKKIISRTIQIVIYFIALTVLTMLILSAKF